MIARIFRLFTRGEPTLSDLGPGDSRVLAVLHGASFNRGWTEAEFERLLLERNVVGHRASVRGVVIGFILSRMAAGEAEILSIAVARSWRGKGLARRLLELHLRRLAGFGIDTVFLEVEEGNSSARRLYDRAGFRSAGRREAYYSEQGNAAALVLRRDLAPRSGIG